MCDGTTRLGTLGDRASDTPISRLYTYFRRTKCLCSITSPEFRNGVCGTFAECFPDAADISIPNMLVNNARSIEAYSSG